MTLFNNPVCETKNVQLYCAFSLSAVVSELYLEDTDQEGSIKTANEVKAIQNKYNQQLSEAKAKAKKQLE